MKRSLEDGFDPSLNRKCWEVGVENLDQFISLQISLDKKTIAIHRSNKLIQFVDRETGNIFVQVRWTLVAPSLIRWLFQGCKNPKRDIIGVFFVESAEYDLIMVTDTAIEFYNFTSKKREGLKMIERMRHTIKSVTFVTDIGRHALIQVVSVHVCNEGVVAGDGSEWKSRNGIPVYCRSDDQIAVCGSGAISDTQC